MAHMDPMNPWREVGQLLREHQAIRPLGDRDRANTLTDALFINEVHRNHNFPGEYR